MTAESQATVGPGTGSGLWDPEIRSVSGGATALIALFATEYIAVGTAMPTVARALDGLGLYALAFGATIATGVIGMILGGWWSDRAGPGQVVAAGCAVFAGGLLVAGLAPTMEVFVAGRAVQGLGSGLASVAVYVLIAQRVPDVLRPKVFSLLAAAWVLPGLIGPVATGLVVEFLTWRWVFLGVVPLVLAALLVLRPALLGTSRSHDASYLGPATIGWAVLAALSVGVLNLAGESIQPREVLVGAPVVLLLVLAAWRLLPPGTLGLGRGLPSVIAARGAIGASFMAAEAYLPLLLQDRHDYAPAAAGAVLAVGSVTWALGSWVQGRLADQVDRYRLLVRGCLPIAAGLVVLVVSVAADWPGWTVLVVWAVVSLGVGLSYPTTSLLTLRLSPPAEVGRNSSSLQVSEALASAVALAVAGAAFTALYAGSHLHAFLSVTCVGLVAGFLAVLTSSRARPHPHP
ncbi:MFS transporter [Ornithinicoccus hortensis]|uniref:Putative MFS family arabinose efflux permease n=1 Tax=Ornithinicoccus hortensis TaxID=82346 RepID=A0A542YRZ3_9MICO|nr:MFS transporter [Ornithinicoccus hortensis]TQL50873.1 putative MFS family arabinose efflux permease [Ornithinicoccus hortensis]